MAKNLLIVESPAKCKTIMKYLGSDYEVMASYGHIADLAKKNMGIDIENNFTPTYIVSEEKKRVVNQLKKAAKKAEKVRIATDEDREGEAIGRHVAQELGLDVATTPRIVFHEITKPALKKAIESPRLLDLNLINAQQARRILDRLVGFELSPVLWKKIKGGLSAGRVQSVATRLIVDREREIQAFNSQAAYKVEASMKADGKTFQAQLAKKLKEKEEVHDFLNEAKDAIFSIEKIEQKPGKKSASAPFTTSTLQQESSRKSGMSVSQTMRVAQKLYEAGHITYMRTDSLNLSASAKKQAEEHIIKTYGKEYSKPTSYKSKSAGAQEAHECIRPTNLSVSKAGMGAQEQRLYSLIRKRTIASQMAPAVLQKTKATINVSTSKRKLIANGEVISFHGFLKVYEESKDDEQQEQKGMLPPLHKDQILENKEIVATQTYDRHPARYTEASLVKKLEAEGIGRPSTYAPTIATIQKRAYVVLEDRPGEKKPINVITLKAQQIIESQQMKTMGAEKKKLFPTDIGLVVNDFLIKHFAEIVDYKFTASVEQQFDQIAEGEQERTSMLNTFYGPFHAIVERTGVHAERESGERVIGKDPKTGKTIIARIGRYGPLVQKGDSEDEDKEFASIRGGLSIETITLEQALEAFALPRKLGEYNEKEISVSIGRFGPYVKRGSIFASIKKSKEEEPEKPQDDPYTISKERCIELIEAKIQANKDKLISTWEHDGVTFTIEKGRRGAFLRAGKQNIRLPKERKEEPEKITLEQCLTLYTPPEKKKTKAKAKTTTKTKAKSTTKSKTTIKKKG